MPESNLKKLYRYCHHGIIVNCTPYIKLVSRLEIIFKDSYLEYANAGKQLKYINPNPVCAKSNLRF
jgi:hypothetical protein